MPIVHSPDTGDFGINLPGTQAVRLLPSELAPIEAIMIDRSQFPPTPLEQWGFVKVATHSPQQPIPTLSLILDLSTRTTVNFLEEESEGETRPVAELVFDEPHSDLWWDGIHSTLRLLVYVGDVSGLLQSTSPEEQREQIDKGYVGLVIHMALRGYSSGVGTAAPNQ